MILQQFLMMILIIQKVLDIQINCIIKMNFNGIKIGNINQVQKKRIKEQNKNIVFDSKVISFLTTKKDNIFEIAFNI